SQLAYTLCAILLIFLVSCAKKESTKAPAEKSVSGTSATSGTSTRSKKAELAQLPVRFRQTGYITQEEPSKDVLGQSGNYQIKVGADITSIKGPQPLRDILKRLANLKGMSVSWASDVDQNVKVDVNIKAKDNFFDALDNLLRQVDYYYKVEGSTIVIKYKETRTYQVAMPFIQQEYETATGGDLLGGGKTSSKVGGTISLISKSNAIEDSNGKSQGNTFDIWKNIQSNLNTIIDTWTTAATNTLAENTTSGEKGGKINLSQASKQSSSSGGGKGETNMSPESRQISPVGNSYTIDKPVGLITVNAPKPLQKKIKNYLDNLKHQLYKGISIEAKIIEVQMTDSSSLGIDWHLLLSNLSASGGIAFNNSYKKDLNTQYNNSNSSTNSISNQSGNTTDNSTSSTFDGTHTTIDNTLGGTTSSSYANSLDSALAAGTTAATIITGGASNAANGAITLASFNFADFIHALREQGQTTILSNPKISVMNGQPGLITVGRNVTYIDKITAHVQRDAPTTYTPTTASILSGVGLSITAVICNDDEIILNLVPVTSVLEEPIAYESVSGGRIGLPVVNIREISTMVKVKNNAMLVIGGLISDVESSSGSSLFPGVSDIPVLKYFFGHEEKVKRKRELIILLKPHIM
ncbi:MAG TPA: hypothetical protein ENH24_03685, partial [Nitrospirae bacterium]|nr:hypothetical protein [Nitrospirota bacterium]